ncbi:MAG: UvrD-helicase domain-containing protein [Candidatus Cloacimonetes bacterium]|nr:UvrD-helicase domain-containing protein [Candidatus Cloacimonadota bacterium]
MTNLFAKIITASAGTGKTYRLSLEYLILLLRYYKHPDFRLDNILVLTFTRKATAEIRDRILSHLQLLITDATDDQTSKDKLALTLNLNRILGLGSSSQTLTEEQYNILISARQDLARNKDLMQVMTIDSYISSIFRNMVRPVRSIESFEIDLLAVQKRLPFLLAHLMQSNLKDSLKSLLRRKISPALEDYNSFFASLIYSRWLYRMIASFPPGKGTQASTLADFASLPDAELAKVTEMKRQEVIQYIKQILELMRLRAETPNKTSKTLPEPRDLVKKALRDFLDGCGEYFDEFAERLLRVMDNPRRSRAFFSIINKDVFWDRNKFSAKSYPDLCQGLEDLYAGLLQALADYLIFAFQIPEQREIRDIWQLILDEYDRLIYRYKNMTYDDIAWFTFEALFSENPPIFKAENEALANEFYQFLSHRSRFILLDEFQDTSLIQINILKPIIEEVLSGEGTKPFGGFIVVGDEKQSIFGWRGGERDLLLKLEKIFAGRVVFSTETLASSWRSSVGLMDFINGIFGGEALQNLLSQRQLEWHYQPVASMKLDLLTELEVRSQNFQTRGKIQTSKDSAFEKFVNEMVLPHVNKEAESQAILCRKTKELGIIQLLLEEKGVANIFQPSASLLDHDLVHPLVSWLTFVAYGDWMEFLKILRSDYILLNAKTLKQVIRQIRIPEQNAADTHELPKSPPDFSMLPLVQELYTKAKSVVGMTMTEILNQFIEPCLADRNLKERDYLNLSAFLEIAAAFELESGKTRIPDFLKYLIDNQKQEFMRQRSLSSTPNLELQTIHKAKGLEYDRVFVFYDLSSRDSDNDRYLRSFIEYQGQTLEALADYAITLNYKHLLKSSSFAHLARLAQDKEDLEELNILYVAFTRAKTKLHIFFCFESSKDWEAYFSELGPDKLSFPKLVCQNCLQNYESLKGLPEFSQTGGIGQNAGQTQAEAGKNTEDTPRLEPADWRKTRSIRLDPESSASSWQQCASEEKARLKGLLAHHYLSFLKHNDPEEREFAYRQCLAAYSYILPEAQIRKFTDDLQALLPQDIFAPHWNKVFTEFSFWYQDKEYRLDRLMLDTQNKIFEIIDFKTGGIHSPDQLNNYLELAGKLEALKGYTPSSQSRYLKIEI